MKKKNLTSNEEITKLYTDTYRSRMPLYNDYVFHRIYGSDTEESRAALIGLLNIILERKNDPIRHIEITNPIDLGDWILDKESVMDIKAKADSGELLTIEMQVSNLADYRCRTLFYGGRLVNSSLKSGESYGNMKKSIVVSIIESKLFPKDIGCHSIFSVLAKSTRESHLRRFARNSFSVSFRERRSNPSLSQTTSKSRLRKPLSPEFSRSPCGWMFSSKAKKKYTTSKCRWKRNLNFRSVPVTTTRAWTHIS